MRPGLLTLCFAVVMLTAKVATVVLRLVDGGGAGLGTAWAPVALLAPDLWLLAGVGAASAMCARATRGHPRADRLASRLWWLLYGVVAIYVAANVPVARVFSTPTTFGFIQGAGSALGDSFAVYLTPVNIGLPAALILLAVTLPRWLRPPATPRFWGPAVAVVAIALALSPRAARSVITLGLHRNAVVTLVSTTFEHHAAGRASPTSTATPPLSDLLAAGDADDLTGLAGAAAGRNVVWIILESTAARHLTLYGGARETTPFLSALAQDAVIFEHAYAAYPESIKGLFSMLCAHRPAAHTTADRYAAGRHPCASVVQAMGDAGYRTGLFHSGRFAYLGMESVVRQRGFDDLNDAATIGGPHASSFGVDDVSTVQKLLAFVDASADADAAAGSAERPFFALYMPIAGHHPYRAPGDGPRPFAERSLTDRYHNDLYAGDAALGLLRKGLQARGLDRRTLYVVVGDHGEAFHEHEGNFAHTLFLYEENLRVPLLFAAPGRFEGTRRARQLASTVDVAPTLLAMLGLPVPGQYQGRSLLEPRAGIVPFFTDQGLWQIGLRDGPWKFIHDVDAGRSQLFDLGTDPGERRNLASLFPDRAARYLAYLGHRGS